MIQTIKLSLMETVEAPKEDNKGDYIIRSSGSFKPAEYWENTYRDKTPNNENFEDFLSSALDLIFRELKESTKQKVDTVGIWIDDGEQQFENALKLETLDEIEVYSMDGDVVPIYELYKMTVPD